MKVKSWHAVNALHVVLEYKDFLMLVILILLNTVEKYHGKNMGVNQSLAIDIGSIYN